MKRFNIFYSLIVIFYIFSLFLQESCYSQDVASDKSDKLVTTGLPAHWNFINTGNNITIIIPKEINPGINGESLLTGDYVGVFTTNGICAGLAQWNNAALSIAAWGDDSFTPEIDGFQAGELINYRVFRESDQSEWINVEVSYQLGSGTFSNDPYMVLSAFNAVGSAVPVELTSFCGTCTNGLLQLNWKTESEHNSYSFEVYMSTDKENYINIGSVRAKGTTSVPHEYTFQYKMNKSGKYYIRLKQIDLDGSFEYFEAIEVIVDQPQTCQLLQNYPNPFNNSTVINFSLSKSEHITLKIYNIAGQEVENLYTGLKRAGFHSINWNVKNSPSGVYICKLQAGTFCKTINLIYIK